jgi:ABC-type nitrate/sulfonate/bicarbonate transport system ATPase subunit
MPFRGETVQPAAPPESTGLTPDILHLRCEGVGCVYESRSGAVRALEDVSFSAQGQEILSIVGPSGCGKSTLLRIIAGLQSPSTGQVSFEGQGQSERPRCGLVFQETGVFPWMTVLENLAFGLEMQGVPRAQREERAMDVAVRLGLGGFVFHYPRELSVGMRQRVDIGRAFVADAPMLLMDEPFGALDAQTRRVLQEELLSIWHASRKLVVFITHDIDEAVLLADRVIVLSGRPGRVRDEIVVPLPRPRDLARDRSRIQDVTRHIWHLLEADVRRELSIAR